MLTPRRSTGSRSGAGGRRGPAGAAPRRPAAGWLLHDAGTIDAPDPAAAFALFYGLVVRDTQIRVLLGEPAPSAREVRARSVDAVARFLRLTAPVAGRRQRG